MLCSFQIPTLCPRMSRSNFNPSGILSLFRARSFPLLRPFPGVYLFSQFSNTGQNPLRGRPVKNNVRQRCWAAVFGEVVNVPAASDVYLADRRARSNKHALSADEQGMSVNEQCQTLRVPLRATFRVETQVTIGGTARRASGPSGDLIAVRVRSTGFFRRGFLRHSISREVQSK